MTASEVFPVGASVRGSSEVTVPAARRRDRGPARVYSKALVEENRKTVGGKIESRGVEQVFPVGGEPGARVTIARCNPQG